MGYQPWYTSMVFPALQIPLYVEGTTDNISSIPEGNFTMTLRSSGGIDTAGTGTFTIVTTYPAVITYQFSTADVATAGTYQLFVKALVPGTGGGLTVYDPISFVISPS